MYFNIKWSKICLSNIYIPWRPDLLGLYFVFCWLILICAIILFLYGMFYFILFIKSSYLFLRTIQQENSMYSFHCLHWCIQPTLPYLMLEICSIAVFYRRDVSNSGWLLNCGMQSLFHYFKENMLMNNRRCKGGKWMGNLSGSLFLQFHSALLVVQKFTHCSFKIKTEEKKV